MNQQKLLSKLIEFTRYIPFVLAFICVLLTVCDPFGVSIYFLDWIFGVSLTQIYTLYILSYLLKFCWKHRLAIHFLSTYWLVSFIDSIYQFPITDFQYSMVIIAIAILFLLYYIIKDKIPWMQ